MSEGLRELSDEERADEVEVLREREDPRVQRALANGLKAEGIDIREDEASAALQERADKIAALGHVPSDGSLDAPVEGVVLEAVPDSERENETEEEELTKDELLEKARELEIEGRSSMNKEELAAAVAEAEAGSGEGHQHEAVVTREDVPS